MLKPIESPSLHARMRKLADTGHRSAANLRACADAFEAAYLDFISNPDKEGALAIMIQKNLEANQALLEANTLLASDIEAWMKK